MPAVKRSATTKSRKTKDLPPVRVKYLPPTIEEAIFAAQGLTDDMEQQAAIAADLMDVPAADVLVQLQAEAAKKPAGGRRDPRLSDQRSARCPGWA